MSLQAQGVEVTKRPCASTKQSSGAVQVPSDDAVDEQSGSAGASPVAEATLDSQDADSSPNTLPADSSDNAATLSAEASDHIFCAEEPNVFVYSLSSTGNSIQEAMAALNRLASLCISAHDKR